MSSVIFSGIGRENGTQVIESYTQTKTVYVEMNDVDCGQLYQEWILSKIVINVPFQEAIQ